MNDERLLVSRLRAAGITVQVAYPLRVRAFARACGYEAKTDALNARVLARYGQVFPASDTCPSESEEEREELQQLPTTGHCSTRMQHGWTRRIRPCGSAVRPSTHKPRCTAVYRGWAP